MNCKGIIRIGNLYYDSFRNGFDGNVQGISGIAQTVLAANGGGYILIEYEI